MRRSIRRFGTGALVGKCPLHDTRTIYEPTITWPTSTRPTRCEQSPSSVRQTGDKQLILTLLSRLSRPPRHLEKNYVRENKDGQQKLLPNRYVLSLFRVRPVLELNL